MIRIWKSCKHMMLLMNYIFLHYKLLLLHQLLCLPYYHYLIPKIFLPSEEISPPKDAKTPVESSISVSLSSLVGSSSPVRLITPPLDYPFDESIFAELDNSLWILPRPLGGEPDPKEPNESDAYDHLWK
nr:hypothetical protein [Tanacetum cinerariifolium]